MTRAVLENEIGQRPVHVLDFGDVVEFEPGLLARIMDDQRPAAEESVIEILLERDIVDAVEWDDPSLTSQDAALLHEPFVGDRVGPGKPPNERYDRADEDEDDGNRDHCPTQPAAGRVADDCGQIAASTSHNKQDQKRNYEDFDMGTGRDDDRFAIDHQFAGQRHALKFLTSGAERV